MLGATDVAEAQAEVRFLTEAAASLGVELSVEQAARLVELTDRLLDASEYSSLTAIRDRQQVLVKHHLDSLSLCRWIGPEARGRLADVGSGAGFPGLPVAVARPQLQVVLIESVLRKARFLEDCVEKLKLSNVRVVRERAETLGRRPEWREQFDFAAIRAVGSLALSLELCAPLVRPGGVVLVMKGPKFREEWEPGVRMAERVGLGALEAQALTLPGAIERVVVVGKKEHPTTPRFPRRPGLLGRV